MVHVEGPGGDEFFPRERSRLDDHERRAIERFRCPTCDAPLELLEMDSRPASDEVVEGGCVLVAACRRCMVTISREDWRAHLRAA